MACTARQKNGITIEIFNYRVAVVGKEQIGDQGLCLPGDGLRRERIVPRECWLSRKKPGGSSYMHGPRTDGDIRVNSVAR
jgi:hypothetical protein